MRIVGDESVDFPVLRALQNLGHDVWSVAIEASGSSDPEVLRFAREQCALLLTSDKDFGTLVIRQGLPCEGIVLLRLFELTPSEMAQRVTSAFVSHGDNFLGRFTVITLRQIRIRSLRRTSGLRPG